MGSTLVHSKTLRVLNLAYLEIFQNFEGSTEPAEPVLIRPLILLVLNENVMKGPSFLFYSEASVYQNSVFMKLDWIGTLNWFIIWQTSRNKSITWQTF